MSHKTPEISKQECDITLTLDLGLSELKISEGWKSKLEKCEYVLAQFLCTLLGKCCKPPVLQVNAKCKRE